MMARFCMSLNVRTSFQFVVMSSFELVLIIELIDTSRTQKAARDAMHGFARAPFTTLVIRNQVTQCSR